MSDPRILIVDDDKRICEFLERIFSAWRMTAKSITNPLLVPDEIKKHFYHLVILDVFMPQMNEIDLLVEIGRLCPDTKIIIMTGYADKEIAIKALRAGAFDFLEKPVTMDLLYHAARRALDAQSIQLEHKKTLEELRHRNRELMETNEALSILARNIERTKQETERQIILQIRSLILPIIENLRQNKRLKEYESLLTMLIIYIDNMSSGLATRLSAAMALSSQELRIALLIKNGMTSEEIAEHLHISPETVKTHRRNIRKKLGVVGNRNRLNFHLQSIERGVTDIGHPGDSHLPSKGVAAL